MSYQKPTVTVRQVQTTQSIPLPNPTFESCIIGKGYYWQNPFREDAEVNSIYSAAYEGAELTVDTSEFSSYTPVEGTVIVDLIRTAGPGGTIGEVIPLKVGSDLITPETDFTYAAGTITIKADVAGFVPADGDVAKVRVGFLADRPELTGKFAQIVETQEILDIIGEPEPFNPLAFAASFAMGVSGRSTNIIGADDDFSPALEKLKAKDVYVLAALTGVGTEAEKVGAHVTEMSLPENKKERIGFASRKVPSYTGETTDFGEDATTSDKNTTAQELQTYATGIANRRYFQIHPDMGWVESEVHISTLRSGFIDAVYGLDLKPKLTSNATINGTRYRAFDDITDEVIDGLAADGKMRIRAYYPVPGYIFCAGIAGQVSAKGPAEPLTNRSVPGIAMLNRSNDYFSPTQLDTIAEGGNWILEQRAVGSVVNRHQISTDAVSVESRELSITTQVDYAAKFIRDLVSPLIGTQVINTSFVNSIEALMIGAGLDLVEEGNVRDVKIQDVYQDELEPDTIKADILLLPLYPLNYIKITLEF